MMAATRNFRAPPGSSEAPNEPAFGSESPDSDRRHPDPDETRLKYLISNEIALLLESRDLSQATAAQMTGLAQPDVSRIANGNVKDYSVWRLMRALAALGKDITLTFSDAPGEVGGVYTEFVESTPSRA
jgi:predicted XRE-type DNA-binding protein